MDDNAIVQLYWDRNEAALSETAKKYDSYCFSIAKNIVGNDEDAKECVNDTYLQTWNSIPENKPKMLSTFLGKITRNISINRYKKNNAEKRGGGQIVLVLDELSELIASPDELDRHLKEFRVYENGYIVIYLVNHKCIFNVGSNNTEAFLKATYNCTFSQIGAY